MQVRNKRLSVYAIFFVSQLWVKWMLDCSGGRSHSPPTHSSSGYNAIKATWAGVWGFPSISSALPITYDSGLGHTPNVAFLTRNNTE